MAKNKYEKMAEALGAEFSFLEERERVLDEAMESNCADKMLSVILGGKVETQKEKDRLFHHLIKGGRLEDY